MDRQVFIITGSSRGIGKCLAEHYLEKSQVVCGCSRGEGEVTHPNYRHFSMDVSDEAAVKKMTLNIVKEFDRIDVLINNAGIASMNHTFLMPKKTLETVYQTNVFGSFVFMREVGKVMARQKQGRIVNFTTVATPMHVEGEAAYASSKAAIESLTRIIARELAPYNITVNAVGPTPIYTDLIKNVPPEKIDGLLKRQAFPRFAEMSDISNVIDFFIRPESAFITGQVIYLGGIS